MRYSYRQKFDGEYRSFRADHIGTGGLERDKIMLPFDASDRKSVV